MNEKHIYIKNLCEFLGTLPINIIDNLYSEPSVVLSIYRELSTLGQCYIMRLLFMNKPILQSVVQSWITANNFKAHQSTIRSLVSLQIFQTSQNISLPSWSLNDSFKNSLKKFIMNGTSILLTKSGLPPDKHSKSYTSLDKYSIERWECVLHFMVGSQIKSEAISKETRDLLLSSGLMKLSGETSEMVITKEGFQFLLIDKHSQIWYFLMYYFEFLKSNFDEMIESLKFILQLNFSIVGQDYPTTNLSPYLNKLLQNLRELGIVYQRKRSDGRYYPTPLAVNLVKGAQSINSLDPLLNTDKQAGHVIVETNFRVYAYTDTDLQIELLALFCDMQYRFPKFAIGIITRDSVRQALKCGITASQIINYLKIHTHPNTLKNVHPIPMTVCDQIMLWEMEKSRFKFTEGALYNQFLTHTDYELIHKYGQEIGAIEWSNPNKRLLVVGKDGHDDVKKFWKRHRHSS